MPATFTFKRVEGSTLGYEPPSAMVPYRAEGIKDPLPAGDFFDWIASQALSQIPYTFAHPQGTLYRQDIRIEERFNAAQYLLRVPYGPAEKPQAGAYQITLDSTGGTVHVTAGNRISGWGPPASGTGTPGDVPPINGGVGDAEPDTIYKIDNGGLIGVDGDEVHGTDIPVEESKISVSFRHPQGVLDFAYLKGLNTLTGYVNADTFLTYEPGEVRYLGGIATETESEATAQYEFAISRNRTNIVIGGITVGEKTGWDVISPAYEYNEDNGRPERKLRYIEIIRPGGREWVNYVPIFGWGGP